MGGRHKVIRREVVGLKKKRSLLPALADRLELPEEALSGAAKLTVTADRCALIENHRGILEYSPECIVVNFGERRLSLCGRELRIRAMNRREVLVCGELLDLSWS